MCLQATNDDDGVNSYVITDENVPALSSSLMLTPIKRPRSLSGSDTVPVNENVSRPSVVRQEIVDIGMSAITMNSAK